MRRDVIEYGQLGYPSDAEVAAATAAAAAARRHLESVVGALRAALPSAARPVVGDGIAARLAADVAAAAELHTGRDAVALVLLALAEGALAPHAAALGALLGDTGAPAASYQDVGARLAGLRAYGISVHPTMADNAGEWRALARGIDAALANTQRDIGARLDRVPGAPRSADPAADARAVLAARAMAGRGVRGAAAALDVVDAAQRDVARADAALAELHARLAVPLPPGSALPFATDVAAVLATMRYRLRGNPRAHIFEYMLVDPNTIPLVAAMIAALVRARAPPDRRLLVQQDTRIDFDAYSARQKVVTILFDPNYHP
jgi:hypothetical protein